MGADIKYGLMFGLKMDDILSIEKRTENLKRFDSVTGEPYYPEFYIYVATFKIKFGSHEKGDIMDYEEFIDEMMNIQDNEHKLIVNDLYIGVAETDSNWFMPQDHCYDYYEMCDSEGVSYAEAMFWRLFAAASRRMFYLVYSF